MEQTTPSEQGFVASREKQEDGSGRTRREEGDRKGNRWMGKRDKGIGRREKLGFSLHCPSSQNPSSATVCSCAQERRLVISVCAWSVTH